ncbi:MAG TPA: hypothetical protein VF131_22125 [Blastocatellia bacterium]|nr:hypothetical protein [Blastocatellia bacterium]
MATAPRVIGIILCVILLIASLAFLAPAAIGLIGTNKGKGTRLGLAFAGQKTVSPDELTQTIKVLSNRMKQFGVSKAIVETSQVESEAIQILLPPGTDVERAKLLLTTLGLMELKFVAKETSLPYERKEEAEAAARKLDGGLDKYEVAFYRPRAEGGAPPQEGYVILEKTPIITGADVRNAEASQSQFGGNYQIDFLLTPDASARFGDATGKHVGDYLAIVLNNEVRSAPVINDRITDRGQITGGFTQRSAEDLAVILNTGSLPRPLQVVSEQTVDASRWTSGHIKRIMISGIVLLAVLAFLYKLVRSRPASADVYWPQTYGQSG